MPQRQPPVGDLLFDDVAQIQRVAASQLPQPLPRSGIHEPTQRRGQQSRNFISRQRLQVQALETGTAPNILHRNGKRLPTTDCQQQFRCPTLDDLK